MKCGVSNCPEEAVAGLTLNVPAMNCPIKEHDAIKLVVGVCLCDHRLQAEDAPSWFAGPGNKLRSIVCIRSRMFTRPDFDRAFAGRIEFDSDEWKQLTASRPPAPPTA